LERRLLQKEETLDRKIENTEKKEEGLVQKENEIAKIKLSLGEAYRKQAKELEHISGLTTEQARQSLLDKVEKDMQHEIMSLIKKMENKAKEEGEKRSRMKKIAR